MYQSVLEPFLSAPQLEEQERKEKEAEEMKKQKEMAEQERKRREAQRRQDALKKVREIFLCLM